jgi:DNA-binding FadR family transcriptional regulator
VTQTADGTIGSEVVQVQSTHRRAKAGGVEEELRARIAGGAWAVGARVPSERQLADEFGVARNTVRKALASLAEAGLISATIGRGTFVANAIPPGLSLALRQAARPIAPFDAIEVRLLLEPPAAALAATRASSSDYAALDRALQGSFAAEGYEEFERWDAALHSAVIAASRNAFLIDLYRIVCATRDEPRWTALKRRAASPERRRLYDRQHAALVASLRDRDVDTAFAVTQEHLRAIQASLSDYESTKPSGSD